MKYHLLIMAGSLLTAQTCLAEIAVIGHSSIKETIGKEDISRIYLGKSKSLPSGLKVMPTDLSEDNPARAEFNELILEKSSSQLKSYWSKLIFTGKGQPPKDVGSDTEMIELVSTNPNIIGYIDASKVTDAVSVIGKF